MKTQKFTGSFQWGSVRKQLLSLCEDIQSIQKQAGENIEIDIYPGAGTVIHATRTRTTEGTGACCYDDGSCVGDLTESECSGSLGFYYGNGTSCDPNPCADGACCVDTTCSIEFYANCIDMDGEWQGVDTTCSPNPCGGDGPGACCVNADCSIHTQDDCNDLEGTYQGPDTTCSPTPCGSCCVELSCFSDSGAGTIYNELLCDLDDGTWNPGISCDADPCQGACCAGGLCFITTFEVCDALGDDCADRFCADGYGYNDGFGCTPNPCCPFGFCGSCCSTDEDHGFYCFGGAESGDCAEWEVYSPYNCCASSCNC